MFAHRRTRGFTLVELLVVMVIIGMLVALLLPALSAAREMGRKMSCGKNLNQIGLALNMYASNHNSTFPGSARLYKTGSSTTGTVQGWSFLVQILPYMEYDATFKSLNPAGDPDTTDTNAVYEQGRKAVLNMQIAGFQCPSNPNTLWVDPTSTPAQGAFGNYKAMGATCIQSLQQVLTPNSGSGTYLGLKNLHPDGALYPGTGTTMGSFADGVSHTVLCIETIDNASSRWSVGKEMTLVGIASTIVTTSTNTHGYGSFYAPQGFDGTYGPNSALTLAGKLSYLSYDFSPTGAQSGQYEDTTTKCFGQVVAPAYGPSSGHNGVVQVVMGDRSVQAISTQVDVAAFMFIITKAGSDPPDYAF